MRPTCSRTPWSVRYGRNLTEVLDASGAVIGTFADARDAEAVLRVHDLAQFQDRVEEAIDLLEDGATEGALPLLHQAVGI